MKTYEFVELVTGQHIIVHALSKGSAWESAMFYGHQCLDFLGIKDKMGLKFVGEVTEE